MSSPSATIYDGDVVVIFVNETEFTAALANETADNLILSGRASIREPNPQHAHSLVCASARRGVIAAAPAQASNKLTLL